VACPYLVKASALGADGRPAASERIVMGGIGIGSMGGGDQGNLLGRNEVQYVAVCDVRKGVVDSCVNRINGRYSNKDAKGYNDFRELLARKDIDAVHIGTPDHWHAIIWIEACRAGKDVFCQKPETLTLREGKLMVEATRRYNRVGSGGSQRVLEDYKGVVNKCWSGELGPIKSINVQVGPMSTECYLASEPVPEGMDWDMWLGPAPWNPYHPYRCSGSYAINGTSWRSFSDYSGGGMTDWGAHHCGGATFAVDVREVQPVEAVFNNEKGHKWVSCRYASGIEVTHNRPGKGNLDVTGTPGEKKAPKEVPTYKGKGSILGDFLHCVKTREKPFRDIEFAANTMAVCHLWIIAYRLGRSLKWDPVKQEFPGDAEANALADRARREPWVL
jgi:predicted dehydrogenase